MLSPVRIVTWQSECIVLTGGRVANLSSLKKARHCPKRVRKSQIEVLRHIHITHAHKRTGRHFTGGAEKFALKITIFPKNNQFALTITF